MLFFFAVFYFTANYISFVTSQQKEKVTSLHFHVKPEGKKSNYAVVVDVVAVAAAVVVAVVVAVAAVAAVAAVSVIAAVVVDVGKKFLTSLVTCQVPL